MKFWKNNKKTPFSHQFCNNIIFWFCRFFNIPNIFEFFLPILIFLCLNPKQTKIFYKTTLIIIYYHVYIHIFLCISCKYSISWNKFKNCKIAADHFSPLQNALKPTSNGKYSSQLYPTPFTINYIYISYPFTLK